MVNMSKLKTDFTVSFKKVKAALRNLALQSSAVCVQCRFNFCDSQFLLTPLMSNHRNAQLTFEGRNFWVNINGSKQGFTRVFCPKFFKFGGHVIRNLHA